MKALKMVAILVVIFATATSTSYAFSKEDKKEKRDKIAQMVENQSYTFEANVAYPVRGTSKNISGYYSLQVSKDTVTSYLPFFGRAYTAPISSDDNGIKFTSTKFEYKVVNAKKGGWEITIQPKDVKNSYMLNLSISINGYANLRVSSTNRESISFSGQIVPNSKK